jgi:peptidoglycan/xylan/chitin deacetylase (PgdA/CDA1 family)
MQSGQSGQSTLPWFASVMYHRVVDEVQGPDPYALQITTRQFEQQLAHLQASGYEAIAPAQAVAAALGEPGSLKKKVVLTFDDGYADFTTHALPLLQKFRFTATVMLVSDRIGGWNSWDEGLAEPVPLIGLAAIREAQSAGITFGSHGRTHRKLSVLDPEDARAEVSESKSALEDLLGAPVEIFCYPHGDSSPQLRAMVRDAGYTAAFGNTEQEHERYNLSRIDGVKASKAGLDWSLRVSGRRFRLRKRRRAIGQYLRRPPR